MVNKKSIGSHSKKLFFCPIGEGHYVRYSDTFKVRLIQNQKAGNMILEATTIVETRICRDHAGEAGYKTRKKINKKGKGVKNNA